jgi:hypothetical protein
MILGLVTFFSGGVRSWVSGQSQLKAQREARQVMDRMVKKIRLADSATQDTTEDLTIHIPKIVSDTAQDIPEQSITFRKTGSTLMMGTTPLLENVSFIEFKINDSSKLDILFEVDVDNDSNPDITLKTHVRLRNFGT